MSDFSFISNAHPAYIESMYVRFLENPTSIEPEWYHFFKGFEFAESSTIEKRASGTNFSTKEFQVIALINAYRSRDIFFPRPIPSSSEEIVIPNYK